MKSFLKENFSGLTKVRRNIEKNIAYLNVNPRDRERIISGYYTPNGCKGTHSRPCEGI